ncbi:hypothetical protein [Nocardia brasiliensis]|nr:hypothetical protein [Nocardia brasiliensis]
MPNSNTRTLHELPSAVAAVVREVVATGADAIVTDGDTEIAVIMTMADYERLHQYADLADASRPDYAGEVQAMSISQMLDVLGVDPTVVRPVRGRGQVVP